MLVFAKRSALSLLAFAFCAMGVWAQGWQHIGAVQRVEKLKDGVELTAGHTKVRITAFNDSVVRVRVAPQGNFPKDSSWAVITTPQSPTLEIAESQNELKMTAGNTIVNIQHAPLLMRFADFAINVLVAGNPLLPMAFDGSRVHVWKKLPAG